MTSAQKSIVKNWLIASAGLLAFAAVFQLPPEYRLKTGLALGLLFSFWPLVNPEIRKWSGYGAEQQSLGEFIGRHGLLKLWMVGYCALALPFLIYHIYTDDGGSMRIYVLCFLLLVGPPFVLSEFERYQAAAE